MPYEDSIIPGKKTCKLFCRGTACAERERERGKDVGIGEVKTHHGGSIYVPSLDVIH